MFKIDGLDALTRQLEEAEQAIASLDGELGSVSFDPADPASIELAIARTEALVDEKLERFQDNPLAVSLGEQVKEHLRQQIIDRAAEARIENSKDA